MFRDASPPTHPCPAPLNGCQTCPQQTCPQPQRNTTTWLGSSRDVNSTVPKTQTPLLSSSREISELILGPVDPVARVGTYVVMVAGVRDRGGNYRKNQQVEWSIDRTSPGGFIDVDRRDWCDILAGEWDPPRIESPYRAYSSTSRKPLRLTKGTPSLQDDVVIHEGQTWAAVSSRCEGTTKLTAVALDSPDWQNRLKAANIHWIDAWPILPPAKIAQNFSQPLKLQAKVYRSNGAAACGCFAAFEIISSDDAGFKTDDQTVKQVVVPVGQNGIAEAHVVKDSATAGQTRVRTTIVRDNADGVFTAPIRLAQGETVIDWGSAGIQISKSGPAVINGGMDVAYRIIVHNVSSEPLNEIIVSDVAPESFEYQRSVPVGRVLDGLITSATGKNFQKVQWTIPTLNPDQIQTFDIVYKARSEGDYVLISTAQTGSVQAEDAIRTRVVSSAGTMTPTPAQQPAPTATPNQAPSQTTANFDIDINLVCQDTARTGDKIIMHAYIKNNGSDTLTSTLSNVTFSAGLCCSVGASPVHLRPMGFLPPGQTRDSSLEFTAIAPGRQMITLELIAENDQRFTRQVFINVEGEACNPSANDDNSIYPTNPENYQNQPDSNKNSLLEPDPSTQVAPILPSDADNGIINSKVTLNVTAPVEAKVGEEITISLEIGNYSNNDLTNIRLACSIDQNFEIVKSSMGIDQSTPQKPFWDIINPIPANRGSRFVLIVRAKEAASTFCSFTIQQGNIDLTKKECPIVIKDTDNNYSTEPAPEIAPITENPPTVDSESITIPDIEPPAPLTNNPTEVAPDVGALDVPQIDESTLDIPQPDVPEVNNSNDKISVKLTTRRNDIKVKQTFTCQIQLTNETEKPLSAVTLSFYLPSDTFKLIKLGTTGVTNYTYDDKTGILTFNPVSSLEPKKALNYNIRLLPQTAGATELSAIITAKGATLEEIRQNASVTVSVKEK